MKHILLLNNIAGAGLDRLPTDGYVCGTDEKKPDAILVRSAVMHDMSFGENLLAVARAGAGVNNIPIDRLTAAGIPVFNTPGANAGGVKELTVCALLLASRKIYDGIAWANSLEKNENLPKEVEKGKAKFAGVELYGKKLGVIGLGAIGGQVANAAVALGMKVIGCDPFLSVDAAWNIDGHVEKAATFDEVFSAADYITLHVPATDETRGMICHESIAKMKDGVRIVNLSRADLVVAKDIKEALAGGKVAAYVTDFPTSETVGVPGIVTIPHLGASTEEAEENCAVMAADELTDYLENGNIKNSVNFPNTSMPKSGERRICLLHANVPAVLSKITGILSTLGVNIENMVNKSKGKNAYTMLDVTGDVPAEAVRALSEIEGMYRVRTLS